MLPRLLCEELCSLNPGVDRLAFSVVWKLDLFGNIVGKPWFGRSVIRSRGKLSYDHAQAYIDGHKSWDDARAAGASLKHIDLSDGVKEETVRNSVLRLYELSLHTRKRRFDNGALSINNVKLWFSLDQDCNPNGCGPYIIKEANRLIEEVSWLV